MWINRKPLLIGVGARDALEARLIEEAGFDFIWSSSLAVSAAYGVPDASLISMNQFLESARSMREAVRIPVVIDGDSGYGDERNTAYAVKRFEEGGLGGVCFEDNRFPKENSLLPDGCNDPAPIEEFAGKIRAAVETRRSVDFVVIARVEALIAGLGQAEAILRANTYADAGADMILMHSKSTSPEEVLEFVDRWDGRVPLVLVPTTYPSLTAERAARLPKVRMLIYANQVLRAGIKAQQEVLKEIRRAGGIQTLDERLVPMDRVFKLQESEPLRRRGKKPEHV